MLVSELPLIQQKAIHSNTEETDRAEIWDSAWRREGSGGLTTVYEQLVAACEEEEAELL